MPAEFVETATLLVEMPVLADVETVWIPRELVLMPFFADVETV